MVEALRFGRGVADVVQPVALAQDATQLRHDAANDHQTHQCRRETHCEVNKDQDEPCEHDRLRSDSHDVTRRSWRARGKSERSSQLHSVRPDSSCRRSSRALVPRNVRARRGTISATIARQVWSVRQQRSSSEGAPVIRILSLHLPVGYRFSRSYRRCRTRSPLSPAAFPFSRLGSAAGSWSARRLR